MTENAPVNSLRIKKKQRVLCADETYSPCRGVGIEQHFFAISHVEVWDPI